MTTLLLACGVCKSSLAPSNTVSAPSNCPTCGAETDMAVFPAFFEPLAAGRAGEAIVLDTESACFYHPQKRAVTLCDGCGRFLCSLCDVDLNGRHMCAQCIESGVKTRAMTQFETNRTKYDVLALSMATIPILTVYFTVFTAPATLFIVLRYWKAPPSMVNPRGTRLGLVVAFLLAVAQILLWAALAWYLIARLY